MEGLAAFGVACNVFQAVDFSLEAIKIATEISRTGTTLKSEDVAARARHGADAARRIDEWIKKLESDGPLSSQYEKLRDIAKRCQGTALSLEKKLLPLKQRSWSNVLRRTKTQILNGADGISEAEKQLQKDLQAMQMEVVVHMK